MAAKDYEAQQKAAAKRRAQVVRLHKSGKKHKEIGNVLGLSHQRISQILSDERQKGNL